NIEFLIVRRRPVKILHSLFYICFQVAMATGQVLFQRFYYSKSFVRCPVEITAMACITLAWKMEVGQMEIRNVINVFNHMKQFRNGEVFDPVILDKNYVALKNQVIRAETRLLKELGFCCHVKLPHKISIMYLRFLLADDNKKLVQSTWNFMNDSLRTDVCVRYSPETIACSCIWLAGRQLKIPLPENPPWYHVFGVNLSDIEKIAASIMKLYTRKKTKLKVLETKVEEVRLKLQEARLRKKAVSAVVSSEEATSFSSASGSSSPSNNSSLSKSSSPQRAVLSQRALLPPRAFLPQRTVLPQRAIHRQKAVLHQSAMPRHQDEENGHALKDGSRMGVVEASPDLQVDVLVKRLNDLTKDLSQGLGRGLTLGSDITRKNTPGLHPEQLLQGHVILETEKGDLFHDPDYVQEVLTQSVTTNAGKNVANKMFATTNWRHTINISM
ncbi:Cyclin-L2, partial [Armadillidium nasatum]